MQAPWDGDLCEGARSESADGGTAQPWLAVSGAVRSGAERSRAAQVRAEQSSAAQDSAGQGEQCSAERQQQRAPLPKGAGTERDDTMAARIARTAQI